jgi:hypothetical protein
MRNVCLGAWACLFLLSCGDSSRTPPVTAPTPEISPPAQAAGYSLAFSDSFSGLNLSPNGSGRYSWYPGIWWEGKPAPFHASLAATGLNLAWTAGQTPSDTTISSCAPEGDLCHAFRYIYVEARMKWDVTTGAWPIIWMTPTQAFSNATETGELDIFEGQGDPANAQTFFGTIHDWVKVDGKFVDAANNGDRNYYKAPGIDFSQWHTYGALWVPGQVTWYLDDQPVLSAATYPIFDQQNYYVMLGAQEGAHWTFGNKTGVTADVLNLDVEWVRVWQPPSS